MDRLKAGAPFAIVTALVFLLSTAALALAMSGGVAGGGEMETGGEGGSEEPHAGHIHTKGDELTFYEELTGPAPGFTLINQDAREVSLSDLRGKVVVMTFIYTTCTYACPLLETKLRAVQNTFKEKIGKDIMLVSVTVDAEGDTPEVMKRHAGLVGADPDGWIFLTHTRERIDAVLASYKIRYAKEQGTYSHTNSTIIIDARGDLAYRLNGLHYPKDVLIERVGAVLER